METRAHVLLQIDPGRAQQAARYLAALPAVQDAVLTSGAYDVIATVSGSDDVLQRTMAEARRTPGLCMLRVCRGGDRDASAADAPAG